MNITARFWTRAATAEQAMAKRIIAAFSPDPAQPPVYFLGYIDRGWATECRWTPDRARARWLDADEAEVESKLLAQLQTGCVVRPEPLAP